MPDLIVTAYFEVICARHKFLILLACVLEEVKEKGDTQFLNYLVSLIHFLPFPATAVLVLSHYDVYKKWEEKKGVAKAALSHNIFVFFVYKNIRTGTKPSI